MNKNYYYTTLVQYLYNLKNLTSTLAKTITETPF